MSYLIKLGEVGKESENGVFFTEDVLKDLSNKEIYEHRYVTEEGEEINILSLWYDEENKCLWGLVSAPGEDDEVEA